MTGGLGASGGDIDIAVASAPNASGNYNVYVWLLKSFEGATVAPVAVSNGREVDMSFLLSEYGTVALLDAAETGEGFSVGRLLNSALAHFCDKQ